MCNVLCACWMLIHVDRYILWALEKFRQGEDPKEYAHAPKPKKTVRGCASLVTPEGNVLMEYQMGAESTEWKEDTIVPA
jgi:hypothetical protein